MSTGVKRRLSLNQGLAPYVLLGPFVLLFLVFGLFPILFSFYLMFHTWDPVQGLDSMKYVGLENLSFAVEDPLVWTSMSNTLWLAVASGLPQHLVAIPLAYLINERIGSWRNAVMGVYFLPYITSTVAIAIMFSTLFSTDYGAVNALLQSLAESSGQRFPQRKHRLAGPTRNHQTGGGSGGVLALRGLQCDSLRGGHAEHSARPL